MYRLPLQREIERDFVLPYNAKLLERSRQLRKHMTDEEIILWSRLRKRQLKGFQFFRQKPVGGYIVDFLCMKAKLVVEIDGSQHYEEDNSRYDLKRNKKLINLGLNVIRFTNIDVKENIEGVLEVILENLDAKSPLVPLYKRGKT